MPISKSALVTTTVHQFQKLGLVLCMVFNQEFEFCVQTFFTSLLKNSIFIHSEARLSSIMQNWKKLLRFHYCIPKGVTNFECLLLNLHTLNYHTKIYGCRTIVKIIKIWKNKLSTFCSEKECTYYKLMCKQEISRTRLGVT